MRRHKLKKTAVSAKKRGVNTVTTAQSVSLNDVTAALLDLFAKLEINPTQFKSRIQLVDKGTFAPRRLYSHNATIGELLTAWHQNPEYLDGMGNPVPLKMSGRLRSFTALANKAVPSMDPKKLLAELARVGAVTLDKRKFIHVSARNLAVYQDRKLAVHYTLTSLHSYIRTLSHNLGSHPTNSDQLFHRIAWNDAFDRELIPALKIKLRRQGQNFLESFDNWMMHKANARARRSSKGKPAQVSIGIYLAVGEQGKTKRSKLN
jgi:hypothetical protein